MQLNEIYAIKSADFGSEDDLSRYSSPYHSVLQDLKPFSESRDFLYAVAKSGAGDRIWIFAADRDKNLVGVLSLDISEFSPLETDEASYSVDAIIVHPKYRGVGLAQLLYKTAMKPKPDGLELTLVTGESQTPGGKKAWAKFESDPSIEITGYFLVHDSIFDESRSNYDVDELLDHLFGRIGAQLINQHRNYYVFAFPVKFLKNRMAGEIETELLRMYIKMPKVYSRGMYVKTGMFAKYGRN